MFSHKLKTHRVKVRNLLLKSYLTFKFKRICYILPWQGKENVLKLENVKK